MLTISHCIKKECMNFTYKMYGILISICLFAPTFIHAHENTHSSFKPNKRHMHEKKEIKKDPATQKAPKRAARIHKKPEIKSEKTIPAEKQTNHMEHHHKNVVEKKSTQSKTITTKKHQTKVARHHKKEPEINKESIFQKTWGKIKAFFSSKKTV